MVVQERKVSLPVPLDSLRTSWYNGSMVREGVEDVGVPGIAKVNESVWGNRQDTPKPVKLELSRTAFCYGYTSGSLHLYHLEKVNQRKFYAYSEYGFKYTGYMVGDKVLLIPSV